MTRIWAKARTLGSALLLALAAGPWTSADAPPAPAPTNPLPLTHHVTWRARNQIIVDGQPTPLFWAVGMTDPKTLDAYAALGFNAVEIVLSAPTEDTWKAAGDLAQAAADRGLYVLVTLAPPPGALDRVGGLRVSPLDPAYRAAVLGYLGSVVGRGAELPGVVGWVVEAADADGLRYDRSDFVHYLLRWHAGLTEISRTWETPLTDFRGITEGFVANLDGGKPLGLGRASIDLARYRAEMYEDLLDLWVSEIYRLDRKHVVLAGRQRSYRAAISVPTRCDGMLLGLYPGVAEDDRKTHNVHGVDIARRANQFAVLPVLKVSAAPAGADLAQWIAQAVLHGAAGVGLADWRDIAGREDLRRDLRMALLVTRELKLCPRIVAATAAVLYEPFAAGGFAGQRPLYGWLTGTSVSEPGKLFQALARGTICGQIDYLSESSLENVDLNRYSVIIAPLALSLSASDQALIIRYVGQGGTLLVDLGAAFVQTGSLDRLSPELAGLFGVGPSSGAYQGPVSFMGMAPGARFPSLHGSIKTYGGAKPATFDPPVNLVILSNGAAPVLAQWESAPAFAGVMLRQHEKGWALYATTRLWQNWEPGNPAFDAFHRDLFGLGSRIALNQAAGVVPEEDFALFDDGSVMLIKHRQEPTYIVLRNPTGRIYRIWGGMQEIRPATVSPNSGLIFGRNGLQVAEPLPIEVSTGSGRVLVQMMEYGEEGISLALYGPATLITADPKAGLGATPGGEALAHIRIARGAYPVTPGSRHEVRIRPLTEEKGALAEFAAGRDSVLAFDALANTVVTVKRIRPPRASEKPS